MQEEFTHSLQNNSIWKAKWQYSKNVLLLFRINLIKSKMPMDLWYYWLMFRNYLKTGWRNFVKFGRYSFTNLLGLSIGFAASLVLLIFVRHEQSFDRFHDQAEDIYRVGTYWKGEGISDMIVTPQVPLMEAEYPDINSGTRFMQWEDIVRYQDHFVRTDYHYVDSGFTDVFSFPVLYGDLNKTLRSPNQLAMTATLAVQIFGQESVVGRRVNLVTDGRDYEVGAVLANVPSNSSITFSALIPWLNSPDMLSVEKMGNWYNTFMTGFVRLSEGGDQMEVEEKLQAFKDRHFLEERRLNSDIVLLPFVEEHFRDSGRKRILLILGIVALAILIVSGINFINLTVVQLVHRTKEMGVRRVLGSGKKEIVFQCFVENLIVCLLAMVLALAITFLALPMISQFFEMNIYISAISAELLGILLFAAVVIALLASTWPSMLLLSKNSIALFKDKLGWNKSGGLLQRGLMLLQFCISMFLVISTVLIWKQIQFMQQQDLHFKGDQVISVDCYSELFKPDEKFGQRLQSFKQQLLSRSAVEQVTLCNAVPGAYAHNYNSFAPADTSGMQSISLRQLTVDEDFFPTFDMQIVQGRNFNRQLEGDKSAVVINETAMRAFGWDDLNDKVLEAGGDGEKHRVIGVVRDYYYQSLKEKVEPLIHFYHPEVSGALAVKLNANNLEEGIKAVEEMWDMLQPYEALKYEFVDESFAKLYGEQKRLGVTATFFAGMAILLACLGLFSLAAYSIRLRQKEISIRRVLGASLQHLIHLLVKNYGLLLVIGFVLAAPLVYYLIDEFLNDFAHRITITPGAFIWGGGLVIVFCLAIVGLQSFFAALQNPSVVLNDE